MRRYRLSDAWVSVTTRCWPRPVWHDASRSRDARKRHGCTIAMARSELERWKAEHPQVNADSATFEAIRIKLATRQLTGV